jgi:hypothetical protein
VFFSGKVTNSVCLFLQKLGVEPSAVYELTEVPEQLLKDPTSWIESAKVEAFLSAAERAFSQLTSSGGVLLRSGLEAKALKAWGVLDSVLRMIEKPMDVISQPQRVISYFVSPSPPIANMERTLDSVSFDLPISFDEYPATCAYLSAALSALPSFVNMEYADCKWLGTRITIQLKGERQTALCETIMQKRHMAPEFVESLIDTLERTERALEEKSREIERIRLENQAAAKSSPKDLEKWFTLYRNFNRYSQQVLRLRDYFTRSQQLITLLVGQERANAQVREAMRRVGWDNVQEQFPQVIEGLLADFETEKQSWNPEELNEYHQESPRPGDLGQSWLTNS